MKDIVARFARDESGSTIVEYGLILAVVCIGIVIGLSALTGDLNEIFDNVSAEFAR